MNISEIVNKEWKHEKEIGDYALGLGADLNSWGVGLEFGLPKPGNWLFYIGLQLLCFTLFFGKSYK